MSFGERNTPANRAFIDRGRKSSAESLQESRRSSLRKLQARKHLKPPRPFNPFETECWLRRHDLEVPCEGLPVRAHLVKEQTLLAMGFSVEEAWHEDWWVPICDGYGPAHGGHHFRLDQGLVQLDRRDLPARLERRASRDERIAAHLDRLYGPLPKLGAAA